MHRQVDWKVHIVRRSRHEQLTQSVSGELLNTAVALPQITNLANSLCHNGNGDRKNVVGIAFGAGLTDEQSALMTSSSRLDTICAITLSWNGDLKAAVKWLRHAVECGSTLTH